MRARAATAGGRARAGRRAAAGAAAVALAPLGCRGAARRATAVALRPATEAPLAVVARAVSRCLALPIQSGDEGQHCLSPDCGTAAIRHCLSLDCG